MTLLTQKLTEVTKQNKDMKSQIGDLRKYISVNKTGLAKQQTTAAVANTRTVRTRSSCQQLLCVLSVSGEEDDQLTLENYSSSSLDAATTNNTDPSHDLTIDSHDSTPPLSPRHHQITRTVTPGQQGTRGLPIRSIITTSSPRHTDRDVRITRDGLSPSAP